MPDLPQDPRPDSTLALLADPYRYIAAECARHASDVFEARILLQPMICMSGPRAAALFYDLGRFRREGAAPEPLRATLFGKGGVQGLDGEAHRHRKALFMALLGPDHVAALAARMREAWRRAAATWVGRGPVLLYEAVHEPMTRAVCDWAGVPVPDADLERRTRQLVALFDDAASKGPGHLRARMARRQAESWLAKLVQARREGRLEAPPGSALECIAQHRDEHGTPLDERTAAVELLNVLRPTVAVSVFIVLAAHALHLHPEWRGRLQQGAPEEKRCFIDEVRRYYPFFPAVVARVREDFEWQGYRFPEGRRVMLDLYGTNHDPRTWSDPDVFRPQRFLESRPGPFDFVPQGGAEPHGNHRCPGEPVAVMLMAAALDGLLSDLHYEVPPQDLAIDFGRLPALPHSGFVIDRVSLVAA
ncbi:cytochrome P450 [Aquabacterium sp. A7-Y]|uniref:cytochrome P450 n=1 Tax=Aquabacterium sp. A7-Y TaxID=1349605 RepID=UPI00223E0A58|nr:cytochrome P450 [Aquabacterium sp. A7-Y]MCW7537656.1 cytochrome P450 [Aquabacterium sp. A7-Y]